MLALTMGDPTGIGSELTLQSLIGPAALRPSLRCPQAAAVIAKGIADPSSLIVAIRLADRMGATA